MYMNPWPLFFELSFLQYHNMDSLIDFYKADPTFFGAIFTPSFLGLDGPDSYGIYSVLGLRASCRLFAGLIEKPARRCKEEVFRHAVGCSDPYLLHAIHYLFLKDEDDEMYYIALHFRASGLLKIYEEWGP